MSLHDATIHYEDLTFEIQFDYYPASRGAREAGSGVQLEPDEPESWDVTEVKLVNPDVKDQIGIDVTDVMTDTMMEFFNEQAGEYINEQSADEGC